MLSWAVSVAGFFGASLLALLVWLTQRLLARIEQLEQRHVKAMEDMAHSLQDMLAELRGADYGALAQISDLRALIAERHVTRGELKDSIDALFAQLRILEGRLFDRLMEAGRG